MYENRDDLDWEILRSLRADSRSTNVEMARRLGVSEGMVRQRVKRMIQDGIVKKFTIETASKGLKAMIDVSVAINVHTSKVARKLMAIDGVEKIYEVSGSSDVVAIIDVCNSYQLNDIIEKIRATENVTSTGTKLVLNEL